MELNEIIANDGPCECGKIHDSLLKKTVICEGALNKIPELVNEEGAKSVFMLADGNTYACAGAKTEELLKNAGIIVKKYVYPTKEVIEPDEKAVGSAVMHYADCDMIVGVGSGVINDIGKILAALTKKTYMIVGTAPSMDGYASATSSMARDGLKVSLPSKCPDIVVGDLDVLCNAPMDMIRAGVGDMLAKYVSICEWRIATILCGEYYCEKVANMVRTALSDVVALAPKLMKRDKDAVKAVMNGMVLSGIAANYAGISRPVSGLEHYFSHVWDMRGLDKGTEVFLHGIQCGSATAEVARLYEYLKTVTPDKQKALAFARSFDVEKHNKAMLEFVGAGSIAMAEQEKKEGKYDVKMHAVRLEKIIDNWDKILKIMDEETPSYAKIVEILEQIGAPINASALRKDNEEIAKTLIFSKDIRDKYVASRILWDLGITDEAIQALYGYKAE
ncbi:MAG: sn-glycerol-1-phosphate dehydrogenase [Clostridia bacterium]|nr:sn-glycerol-1-phosphate dehydrogenase [Clostridia bacterium]